MRLLLIILPFLIVSCAVRIEEAETKVALVSKKKVAWPDWTPSNFAQEIKEKSHFDPQFIQVPHGEVVTYGSRPDGREHFAVINPLLPPSASVQGGLQSPPAKSKFLAVIQA